MNYDYILTITEILGFLLLLRLIYWFVYWIYDIVIDIIDAKL